MATKEQNGIRPSGGGGDQGSEMGQHRDIVATQESAPKPDPEPGLREKKRSPWGRRMLPVILLATVLSTISVADGWLSEVVTEMLKGACGGVLIGLSLVLWKWIAKI